MIVLTLRIFQRHSTLNSLLTQH